MVLSYLRYGVHRLPFPLSYAFGRSLDASRALFLEVRVLFSG